MLLQVDFNFWKGEPSKAREAEGALASCGSRLVPAILTLTDLGTCGR